MNCATRINSKFRVVCPLAIQVCPRPVATTSAHRTIPPTTIPSHHQYPLSGYSVAINRSLNRISPSSSSDCRGDIRLFISHKRYDLFSRRKQTIQILSSPLTSPLSHSASSFTFLPKPRVAKDKTPRRSRASNLPPPPPSSSLYLEPHSDIKPQTDLLILLSINLLETP